MTTIRLIDQDNKKVTEKVYNNFHKATKHFLDLSYQLDLDNLQFTPFGYISAGGFGYKHKLMVIREDKI